MKASAGIFGPFPLPRQVVRAWGTPEFLPALRRALLSQDALFAPLQQAMAHGSHAHPEDAAFIELKRWEHTDQSFMDIGVFYQSSLPGCACAGDPDPDIPQPEYCKLRLCLNPAQATAHLQLIEEERD